MLNTEAQLSKDLSIDELLSMILSGTRDLGGNKNYVIITKSMFSTLSKHNIDLIEQCKSEGLLEVVPSGKKCFEFHITPKGASTLKLLLLKKRVSMKNNR